MATSRGHKFPSVKSADAFWRQVDSGQGQSGVAERIVVPPTGQYPDSRGVALYKNGVLNRIDYTGPEDDQDFHFDPPPTLVSGDTLMAVWYDENDGTRRHSFYTVPQSAGATATGSIGISGTAQYVSEPPVGGWPDATNTGPSGALTPSGSLTISSSGTYENLDITGKVTINASNVILRNCRITNTTNKYVVTIAGGITNLLIEDCEIDGNLYSTHGVVFSGYTLRRCNVHRCGDGLNIGGNTTIEDCYIHDLGMSAAGIALNTPGRSPHYDGMQLGGGTNIMVRRNNIEGVFRNQTAGVYVEAWSANIGGLTIENNRLYGGGFTMYLWESTASFVSPGVTVTGNTFVRYSSQYGPLGGGGNGQPSYRPLEPHPLITFSNNVFDTGGAVYPGMGYDEP